MFKQCLTYLQYLLPQHLLSQVIGRIAESRWPWLKNFLIRHFMRLYPVDLKDALIDDPKAYPSFNSFFIRRLKPDQRPISGESLSIASPVDGIVATCRHIRQNQLLQAKNIYFDLETLLGGDKKTAELFYDGSFATLYLAPHNYHRVHMPLSGQLEKTIYIPGRLFSVNRMSASLIPNLYGRNERLVSLFHTDAGTMAVILVGALIVGSLQTVWMDHPIRANRILTETTISEKYLNKGDELGYFKIGSTVILLFEKGKITWQPDLQKDAIIHMGQAIGSLILP